MAVYKSHTRKPAATLNRTACSNNIDRASLRETSFCASFVLKKMYSIAVAWKNQNICARDA